jgi:Cd2+/Zn2+-exporting ATPase
VLDKLGLLSLSEVLEHNAMYTVASAASFFASLACNMLTSAALVSGPLWTTHLPAALIGVTFVLSGIPQLVETVQAFAHRQVDTHVLMSLAVVGTAYMGMAQEGALLLLLFRWGPGQLPGAASLTWLPCTACSIWASADAAAGVDSWS